MKRAYNFAAAFRVARESRRLSYRVTAKKLGVSTRTVQNWQNGEWPAAIFSDGRVRSAVADMLDISEVELLTLLGVGSHAELDNETSIPGISNRRPPGSYIDSRRALREVASQVSERHPDWLRMERSAVRGTLTRVQYHTLYGIDPHPSDIDKMGGLDGIRFYLSNTLLRQSWTKAGFHWRGGNPPGWEKPPELLMQISSQERTRPVPQPRSPLAASLQILVLGPRWGHAELMASFMADALSFGNIDLRYTGHWNQSDGLQLDPLQDAIRALRWSGPGYIVSAASPELSAMGGDAIRAVARRSLVISCTYEPFMANVARWVYGADVAGEELHQSLCAEIVEGSLGGRGVVGVHFRDDGYSDLTFQGDHVSREISDRACDVALAAAVRVVRLLSRRFSVPEPDSWIGPISAATDEKGRLSWENDTAVEVKWIQ